MTTIMIRIRLVEDAAQALVELCLKGDVDERTGLTVAPGTTGRGANAIRDLRRMEAEDLAEFDAALDDGYDIIDRIDGTMDNPYAGTTGQRSTIPTRTYLMRKPDEQASAAPSSEPAYALDLNDRIAAAVASSDKEWVTTSEVVQALRKKDERFAGVGDLIKSGKIAFGAPLDESEIQPVDPEQLRAAVTETETFMTWKLVGGEGMPPEGFKAEDVEPVEEDDDDDLSRFIECEIHDYCKRNGIPVSRKTMQVTPAEFSARRGKSSLEPIAHLAPAGRMMYAAFVDATTIRAITLVAFLDDVALCQEAVITMEGDAE